MSDQATIAFWIGTAVGAVFTVLYGYYALYPRRDNGQKVALWLLLQAVFALVTQSGFLIDLGSTLRADGVEYNFARWIAYAVSFATVSVVLGFYLWYGTIESFTLLALSVAFGVTSLLSGLASGNRHWPLWALATFFGVIWAVYLFWKPTAFKASQEVRSRGSKILALIFSIGYVATAGLALATLLFSSAFIGSMTFNTQTWIYGACTWVTTGLPILAVLDYRQQPDAKLD